jgi:hypothetical protein
VTARRVAAPAPRSPSEAALREAGGYLARAQLAVNSKRDRLMDWDPRALSNGKGEDEPFWQQSMALEHGTELRAARGAAQRALALAQTPADRFSAVVLLAWIEHNAGRHAEELRLARRLMRMAPRSRISHDVLQRAVRCAGPQQSAHPPGPGIEKPSP